MNRYYIFLLTGFLIVTLHAVILNAEDPDRGRLPDGRAFRTDNEGNQLVDYIAELELEVESLKRQVQGLEDESSQKQGVIERLQSGKSSEGSLVEKDLIKPQPVLPKAQKPVAVECEPKIIERVVERVVEKPADCPPAQVVAADNSDDEEEISDLKAELNKARQDLDAAVRNIEEKQIDIDILNAKLISQRKNTVVSSSSRVKSTQTRSKAVDMLGKNMMKDLKSLEELAAYRNKLYAKVDQSKFPQPEKVTVDEFKSMITKSEQVHDLSPIRTKINEQRGKIQQEIALYKRELKIR